MSYQTDKALFKSDFERIEGDRYFTEHWCTRALLDTFPSIASRAPFYEPFAGRGDICEVIARRWPSTVIHANDVNISDFHAYGCVVTLTDMDFFAPQHVFPYGCAIITNPPYDRAQEAVERCLEAMDARKVTYVAMLLRSEFDHAARRTQLFTRDDYQGKVILTSRPRWDSWWEEGAPKASPRHNFSWFTWNANWTCGPSMWFAGKGRNV